MKADSVSLANLKIPAQPKILGLGVVVIDHVLSVDRYPNADTKNEATSAFLQMGGPVPTALLHLQHLGWETHFAGVWGDDAFGDLIEQRMRMNGVGFLQENREKITTPVTQVWLEETTGQRTLLTHRPASHRIALRITKEYISQFNVLHLDCWPAEASLIAARLMKQQGGLVCIDTGSPKENVAELLALADVVNCPKRFCEEFCGTDSLEEGARHVASFGPKVVTITDGDRGAVLFADDIFVKQAAFPLQKVVDTNGAGDVFSAGLIHAVLRRWSREHALCFASSLAAFKCRQTGNLPTYSEEELRDIINQSGILNTD